MGMDEILSGSGDEIVNASAERFRADTAMDQPFLAKHSVKSVDGSAPHEVQGGLSAECNGTCLGGVVEVRIVRIERRIPVAQQQQSSQNIGLTHEIPMQVFTQIAVVANGARSGVENIRAGRNALLHVEPGRISSHVVVTGDGRTVKLGKLGGAERNRFPQKLR